jgi:hypothetical protein
VWCGSKIGWQVFKLLLRSQRMTPLCRLQRDAYPANLLLTYFPDMFFNLDPQADVYRRKDPKEEEAITCIEALARIPQQVVKWGHPAVNFCTPHLYKLYYSELVPACSKAVQRLLAVKM